MTQANETSVNLVGAARRVGVTPSAIRHWILTQKLPATHLRGNWIIRVSDLDATAKRMKAAYPNIARGTRRRAVTT